jgi:hypothetical protein
MSGIEARAMGLVCLRRDLEMENGIVYFVITPLKISSFYNYKCHLTRKLETLNATIKWIRPFDRFLQRLFHWGDCWAGEELVQKAIDDHNEEALITYFPALKNVITSGYMEHFAAVAGVAAPVVLCLTDNGTPRVAGGDARRKLYTEHELSGIHTFGEPGKNWECALCNGMPASRCVCGAQRCVRHTKPPEPEHRVAWKQSSDNAAPFFVQDPKWMSKEIKIEWMRDELNDDASLEEFATVYAHLFAEPRCTENRSARCLDLYGHFNPTFTAKRECQLAPAQLQRFLRVFNTDSPPRCHWCSKEIPLELGRLYCNLTCAEADNPPQKCPKCQSEDRVLVHAPRLSSVSSSHCAALTGMSRCKGCGLTEYCEVISGDYIRPKRNSAAPQHWTKRKRS